MEFSSRPRFPVKRITLAIIAALAAVSLFLLTSASSNTTLFTNLYPYLLALNGAVAVVLAGLVFIQLRSLWFEYRTRQFGSRLKYRLMLMFALMALVPGVIMYAVSLQFIVRSIESWFDVRVDAALEGGIALGQNALDFLGNQVYTKAQDMALDLEEVEVITPARLNRLREFSQVGSATVISSNGQIIATSADGMTDLLPDLPSSGQIRQARQGRYTNSVENDAEGHLFIRVLVAIPTRSLANEPLLLQLTQPVPETFARHAETVQNTFRDYQQLSMSRSGLKRIYSITLTLTLLLALLTAVAIAFFLARRLTAPLLILSEGTQAVAQGDFSPRQALPARDELGILTQSFNRMTQQLEDAREIAERNRTAVEAAKAYLESVLANLSTGVLAFTAEGILRTANHGAMAILNDNLTEFENIPLSEWSRHSIFRDILLKGFETHEDDWHEQIEIPVKDSSPITLLIHGSRLPTENDKGFIVVFDDISKLIAAQRTAAWGEVARRLAHEIKNPLTPIQLSAERLVFKLADRLDNESKEMLERSTTTIVNQVEAMKNLVNAFRDYAHLPSPQLSNVDLGALVTEVLNLYESASIRILKDIEKNLPLINGDPSQLRQIIHNMLQNAQDAIGERKDGEILITVHRENHWILLAFRDNGPGFPAEVLARAFEPYFTTKSRGTGLGLAIVKKITDEHGGDVRLNNLDGGGAEVRIRLRIAVTDNEG